MSIFRSAVTDTDGQVDAGYLALYMTMLVVMGAIPCMCVGALIAMWVSPAHAFAVQDLGIGIGAVCGGFGVAIGAVGAFRLGDKPHPAPIVTPPGDNIGQQVINTPEPVTGKRGKGG